MIIPFYTSSGSAGKDDGKGNLFGVGEFFPFWGMGPVENPDWLNKTNFTWKGHPEETAISNDDRTKYYGSTKLRRIANELDALLPDFKAMVNQMENQISSQNISMITHLASREFGVKDEEFNQGLVASGIFPVARNDTGSPQKVRENIRKAKKIIGVDGPITYKLVPFENGHNFAYRAKPVTKSGRFFVLVDINPVRKEILYPDEGQRPVNWNLRAYNPAMSLSWNNAEAKKAGAPLPVCNKCGSYHDDRLECPIRIRYETEPRERNVLLDRKYGRQDTRVRGRN